MTTLISALQSLWKDDHTLESLFPSVKLRTTRPSVREAGEVDLPLVVFNLPSLLEGTDTSCARERREILELEVYDEQLTRAEEIATAFEALLDELLNTVTPSYTVLWAGKPVRSRARYAGDVQLVRVTSPITVQISRRTES
jgi:hypothetical protein